MAHPPGSDTRASPHRASSGPSARIDARIVFTISYGASGQSTCFAGQRQRSVVRFHPHAHLREQRAHGANVVQLRQIVERERFRREQRRAQDRQRRVFRAGNDDLALERDTAFDRQFVHVLRRSQRRPLRRRQRLHRQRVDFLTHPVAERAVHELMLLDFGQAREGGAYDHGLEMLAVAGNFDMLAGEAGFRSRVGCIRGDHDLLQRNPLGASDTWRSLSYLEVDSVSHFGVVLRGVTCSRA